MKRKDVIVVSINWVGPLGFFTHPAIQDFNSGLDKTSNFGILDIILALKWVSKNIDAFEIQTIFDFWESAGGMFYPIVAPQARGLFQNDITIRLYKSSY